MKKIYSYINGVIITVWFIMFILLQVVGFNKLFEIKESFISCILNIFVLSGIILYLWMIIFEFILKKNHFEFEFKKCYTPSTVLLIMFAANIKILISLPLQSTLFFILAAACFLNFASFMISILFMISKKHKN